MYIISNKNDNKRENYENIRTSLPNTKPIVKNFPKNHDDLLNQTNVQTYSGYKNANEELYKPTGYKNAVNEAEIKKETIQFESLTGNTVNPSSLEHNNMVPFLVQKLHNLVMLRDMKDY